MYSWTVTCSTHINLHTQKRRSYAESLEFRKGTPTRRPRAIDPSAEGVTGEARCAKLLEAV
jgi:hypothetical protein